MLSPQAIEREVKVLIRRLFKQKSWVEKRAGSSTAPEKWIVVSTKTCRKDRVSALSNNLVAVMVENCWLKADPTGSLRPSSLALEKFIGKGAVSDFADQHQQRQTRVIKDPHGLTVSVRSNEAESPLGWMRARKDKTGKPLLSEYQFAAGERIRADFTRAQMSARVTSSWEFAGPIGKSARSYNDQSMEINERALAARQRFFAALDCLGEDLSGIVVEICCLTNGLEAAERQFNWPRRSAKLVLQIALSKLSEHYGFSQPDDKMHKRIIRHWGSAGYRPGIPPAS